MAESVVYLLDIVYFLYISKQWVWLQIPNVILCVIGIIWIFLVCGRQKIFVGKQNDFPHALIQS